MKLTRIIRKMVNDKQITEIIKLLEELRKYEKKINRIVITPEGLEVSYTEI